MLATLEAENLRLRREAAVRMTPDEEAVKQHVDEIVDDLQRGRVVPAQRQQIGEALRRAERDAGLARATGNSGRGAG